MFDLLLVVLLPGETGQPHLIKRKSPDNSSNAQQLHHGRHYRCIAPHLGSGAEGILAGVSARTTSASIAVFSIAQLEHGGNRDIRDIQEPILILVFLINTAHQRSRRREDLIDEDEDSLLRGKLDALADDVDKLADGEVGGDEILLLVDGGDVGFFDLFADYLNGAFVVRAVTESRRIGVWFERQSEGRGDGRWS